MPSVANDREAIRVAQRIINELTVPFEIDGDEDYDVRPTIEGNTDARRSAPRNTSLCRRRASALRHLRLGKQRFTVFEPIMRDESQHRLRLDTEIRHAIRRGEIELFYQPIVSLETGALAAFEALAR